MSNTETLEKRFETAIIEIKKLSKKPKQEDMLKLYGLYKRVKVGICNTEKPWAVQIEACMKWNAWKNVSHLTVNQAMITYIMIVNNLFRENNIFMPIEI